MKRVRWLLRRRLKQLGWHGAAGLVLALLAGMVYLGAVIPQKIQLADLRQQAQGARDYARQASRGAVGDEQRTGSQLEQFYSLLPEKSSAPDWLDKIYAAAQSQSVRLERGEYKLTPERNGRIASYEISLPVRGSYVQVRNFVTSVLNAVPTAALDDIVLKRDARGTPVVDANLRFTLFLSEN